MPENGAAAKADDPVNVADGRERFEEALGNLKNASASISNNVNSPVLGIPVVIKVVVGTTRMPVSSLLEMGPGSTIELDQKIGQPVDILVNGRTIARGELVVCESGVPKLGVNIIEVISGDLV